MVSHCVACGRVIVRVETSGDGQVQLDLPAIDSGGWVVSRCSVGRSVRRVEPLMDRGVPRYTRHDQTCQGMRLT